MVANITEAVGQMDRRECDCLLRYAAIECAHADGLIAVLITDDEHWGTAIMRGMAFNRASVSKGTEADVREHYAELRELVRSGALEKLEALTAESDGA